jgi:ATP-dependent helicase/nuclease subunit A
MWETHRIDRWVVELMRKPDLVAALLDAPDGQASHLPIAVQYPQISLDGRERALLRLASLASDRHVRRMIDDGVLDFDRIILWTRDLLRDDADARRSLQRRLRLFIIDEFQDVDPAQKEIACAIGEPATGRANTPRLMLVGDPKQSLYRFRRADVTVWNAVEAAFGMLPGCSVHPLEENFRSVPAILAFVDASIGVLFDRPVGAGDTAGPRPVGRAGMPPLAPFEVRYRPVTAVRPDESGSPAVELFVTPAKANGKPYSVADVRPIEAAVVAKRARELNDTGTPWRDMALLLPTWANESLFTDALRAVGAPVYVLRDEGFFDQREVVDMILALRAARDPSDDVALIGWLRSPFVGLRDDSLLHMAKHARPPYWPKLRDIDLPDDDEAERLRSAVAVLWDAIQLRDRVPAAELLERMLRHTGYLGHLALLGEDGLQPFANVRKFLAYAREMNARGVGDLLRAIRESRERDDRVRVARLHDASDDVLLVTSIHVAKGLEWPVVFHADAGGSLRRINDQLLIGRDTIRLGTPKDANDEDQDVKDLRGRLTREHEAERKRLWYVATTRAKDRLIITGIARGARAGSLGHDLLDLFPPLAIAGASTCTYHGADGREWQAAIHQTPSPDETAAIRELTTVEESAGHVSTAVEESARRALMTVGESTDHGPGANPRNAPRKPAPDPSSLTSPPTRIPSPLGLTRHSATELLAHARCARRHWFKYVMGVHEPALSSSKAELISAVARGQIVHDVLERHAEEAELDVLLEDAIGRWDRDAPAPETGPGRAYRAHLTDEVTRVLEHPDYAEIVARPGARRELPFLHVLENGTAAQGFMDLAAPDAQGDGIELLDVKTTQCDADAAAKKAEQYGLQRDVYVTAAESIAGRPVTRFAFQFSRAQTQVATDLDESERNDARHRVARHVHDIEWPAAGTAPLTSFPEECNFCGYRRVGLCPGVNTGGRDPGALLRRLRRDRFRRSFGLRGADLDYLREKGIESVLAHARDFIAERLAPAEPRNDGRQTPWRGHPVFVAQHATATCCRACLEQWHGIERGRVMSESEQAWAVRVIEAWLAGFASTAPSKPRGEQLDLLEEG